MLISKVFSVAIEKVTISLYVARGVALSWSATIEVRLLSHPLYTVCGFVVILLTKGYVKPH